MSPRMRSIGQMGMSPVCARIPPQSEVLGSERMPQHLTIGHPFIGSRCIKLQHKSMEAARDHLLRIQAKNEVFGDTKRGKLTVYICPTCGFLHVGHSR